ncbi:NAD(P)H-hydrate epimerase [Arthrobacter sp. NA-172]|uniref:NAD(P)H-hydrate epimerase n=1 Tax=Arthrobacter sp. NA-172 TaxID=3367524 RepID=UPI0037548C49
MISAFTGTQIRAAEKPFLDTGEGAVLMQRAAYGLANAVVGEFRAEGRRVYGSSVTVLAGKGNNGGDGLFAAAMLAQRGMRTTAVLTAGSAHPDALAAFRAAGGRVHVLDEGNAEELAVVAAGDDAVIDAVLGTGARGGLSGPAAELIAALQELRPDLVVACDIPSGVDPDTGEVHWPVLTARLTVAFGGVKAGLMADPGEGCAGRVILVPIGVEDHLPDPTLRRFALKDLAAVLPAPGRRAQKYTRESWESLQVRSATPGPRHSLSRRHRRPVREWCAISVRR